MKITAHVNAPDDLIFAMRAVKNAVENGKADSVGVWLLFGEPPTHEAHARKTAVGNWTVWVKSA